MVEAIVKKTERVLAGKSLRNFHYTTAFGQLCDVLATISPHSYRAFRAHFGGPAFRTLRYVIYNSQNGLGSSLSVYRRIRARAPKFLPGIHASNFDAAAKVLEDLDYHGPVTLSYDDTELEKALSVYENSKGFLQVIGHAGEPIPVAAEDDLDAVFTNANLRKASKVCYTYNSVNDIPPDSLHSFASIYWGSR